MKQSLSILKEFFGFETFWPLQEEVITHILKKKDALVVMPTGGGKSLCYQIPGMIFDGLTIVISPLISLMKDQVDQLREIGVPALFLNSSLSIEEYRANVEKLKKNKVKLLYLSPEGLLAPRTLALLSDMKVDCIAVDEAHCISVWGHDFRPEYRQLTDVRSTFPSASCVALTATATPRVRQDIRQSLSINDKCEYVGSFNRSNLFLEVRQKNNPLDQVLALLKQYPNESGIIYCATRQRTEKLHSSLHREGYSVRPYHAGLSEKERTENQELFSRDDIQIIVATIAFGMGINKPNVRFVIHYDLPGSIDNYYQEIGRAGRDGLPAHCLLLFGYGDIHKVRFFIEQKTEQEQRVANILLSQLLGFAETDLCRRIPLLNYFGESQVPEHCGMCDNCRLKEEEKGLSDLTVPAQMFLSCVKRTGEFFGAAHIIDVLRGSKSQKVLKFGHEKLSTYGIGIAYSAKQWHHMARQFIHRSLLQYNYEHGTLKLTPRAWGILRGEENFQGRIEEDQKDHATVLQQQEGETETFDSVFFEALRKKRKELADQANLPPYTIFHDRTLREMATHYPRTRESLLALHGVGKRKLEKYADIFLEIIIEHCKKHQIPEQQIQEQEIQSPDSDLFEALRKKRKELADQANLPPFTIFYDRTLREMATRYPRTRESMLALHGVGKNKVEKYADVFLEIILAHCKIQHIQQKDIPAPKEEPTPNNQNHKGNSRHLIIGERFNQGQTIDQLAVEFKIQRDTALNHLYQYLRENRPLQQKYLLVNSSLMEEQQKLVLSSFARLGTERLRPVFEDLSGTVPYTELKLLRLYYLCLNQTPPEGHKTFVCLAASRKYGGYCVAGKEWTDGKVGPWIRPVSKQEAGELSTREIRMNNGRIPQCLDIVTIDTQGAAYHPCQKENVLIAEKRPWVWQRKLPFAVLLELVDDVDSLWQPDFHSKNGVNDRVPEEIVREANEPSLYLIRPESIVLVVSDDLDGRKKVQARFTYNETLYLLSVTDPGIERIYLRKDNGEYPLTAGDLFLTLSLGEPFNGFCYKLAVAVIAVD